MDFRATILPHRDRLYRLALSLTADAAEAEDIVQDTILRAWERKSDWPAIGNIEAWLVQICKNLSLDRKKRLDRHQPLGETDSLAATTPATDIRESAAILQQLITQLPPPLDELLRLRDIEGLSYREIAQHLDLTEDQVRVYLHRARGKIREQYLRMQHFGLQH